MKDNITKIHDCYGCGVCTIACGKKLISMRKKDGFYHPYIDDQDACVECGLCLAVCAHTDERPLLAKTPKRTFAAWSKDNHSRKICSSGGIGMEISQSLMAKGYKVLAARFNVDENRVEHYVAETPDELFFSAGSKYLQSFTPEAFAKINKKEKFLVTGTPCQIDSMRRWTRRFKCEDNFIFMDFFCHGVPSYLMWEKYLQIQEAKIGKLQYVGWRNKEYGWHDSWCMTMESENQHRLLSRWKKGDIFYCMFLGDFCMNKSCMATCKYKYLNSSADIRIGDLWGHTYKKEEKGVSSVVVFTNKGMDVVNGLQNTTLIEHPIEVVAEHQMKKNAGKAVFYPLAQKMIHSSRNFSENTWKLLIMAEKIIYLPKRVINKFFDIITH